LNNQLKAYLLERAGRVNEHLERLLPHAGAYPPVVHEAMRYAVFAGGKRLRPILVLACAEAVGGRVPPGADEVACAVECIHNYSLIHDDLPCMDDDQLRRGQPTVWVEYGEAQAVLAGDALLTLAFCLIAEAANRDVAFSDKLLLCSQELAAAAGTYGMIGGQVVDIASEDVEVDVSVLDYIHTHKTGALIRCSCRLGAILAGADAAGLTAAGRYGEHLGLAFQITDDLLNVEGTKEKLGKAVGSDAARGKTTYPERFGLEGSREKAAETVESAVEEARRLPRSEVLVALARYVLARDH